MSNLKSVFGFVGLVSATWLGMGSITGCSSAITQNPGATPNQPSPSYARRISKYPSRTEVEWQVVGTILAQSETDPRAAYKALLKLEQESPDVVGRFSNFAVDIARNAGEFRKCYELRKKYGETNVNSATDFIPEYEGMQKQNLRLLDFVSLSDAAGVAYQFDTPPVRKLRVANTDASKLALLYAQAANYWDRRNQFDRADAYWKEKNRLDPDAPYLAYFQAQCLALRVRNGPMYLDPGKERSAILAELAKNPATAPNDLKNGALRVYQLIQGGYHKEPSWPPAKLE